MQPGMTMQFSVLQCGQCETLKAGVHATALGLAVVMGVYNAAAWLSRRDHKTHLAVNTILYTVLTIWEQKHVEHHLAVLRRCRGDVAAPQAHEETPAPAITLAA
jgi:hypothetical protein